MVLNLGTLTATCGISEGASSPMRTSRAKAAAIANGYEILGAYASKELRAKIWIITEADRSYTTILFPSEY